MVGERERERERGIEIVRVRHTGREIGKKRAR